MRRRLPKKADPGGGPATTVLNFWAIVAGVVGLVSAASIAFACWALRRKSSPVTFTVLTTEDLALYPHHEGGR